ncbi:hypothetical protein B5X24_HaOG205818 [Helicoverpa armigera]|nr:hypothetical protein B5X24_HaOG205818 [Helicoverpa armigera]
MYNKSGEFKPRTWIVDDENGQPITEIDKVLERWRAYTEQLYRDDTQPLIRRWESHELEPDILLAEVEHAISRLKNNAVGTDQIPANLLKSLGSVGTKLLHNICLKVWRTGQWPKDWVESIVIPLHKKGSTRQCSNYRTLSIISHASKIMLRIISDRLSSYLDRQIPAEQSGFVAGRGTREQILNIRQIIEKCYEFNKPVVLCFIDYSKAFDCVNWQSLLSILLEMGVPKHLAFLVQNLYADSNARIRLEDSYSKPLRPERGVRQGCILSPKLFNIYGEHIVRAALEGWEGGLSVGGRKINNLRYADDTTLVASSEEEMAVLFDRIESESAKLGLQINKAKTKLLTVDREQVLTNCIRLNSLDRVRDFNYLGSLITNDGNCDREIIRRIQISKGAMTKLEKIWKNKNITKRTKVRLVHALVFPIFLYGSETWTIKANVRARIDAFEMWIWRRMLRIPWTAFRRNESILKELKITVRLYDICQSRMLKFLGHIARSGPESLEKLIIMGKVEGKRQRGRVPARWCDQTQSHLQLRLHEAIHTAADRSTWRKLSRPSLIADSD